MRIRCPDEIKRDKQAVEDKASALMDEFPEVAPLDLARDLMADRGKVEMDGAIIPPRASAIRSKSPRPNMPGL